MDKLSDLAAKLAPYLRQPRWIYLQAPLTSTSWDGDSFSDVSTSTLLNLSSVFGCPGRIKAVMLDTIAIDSAAWGTDGLYITFGPSATYYYHEACRPKGGDVQESKQMIIPCNPDGNIYFRINASGTNTMDIWIRVLGYYS